VLHDRDDPGGHEPPRSDRPAAPGDLRHLDHPPGGGDLHPPPRLGGLDLEALEAPAGIDRHLDPIALHVPILGPPGPQHGAVRPFSGEGVWYILLAGTILQTTEGGTVKKFLILLGIIGLVVAIAMYMRSRQGELDY